MPDSFELRRVVTSLDASGKAIVLFDGENPHKEVRPLRGNVSRAIWATQGAPAEIQGNADRAAGVKMTSPANGGTVFRIIDYPPTKPEHDTLDVNARMNELKHEAPIAGWPPRHPFMHRTRSIDYAIILSGEIDMLLDDSEVHLKAGDVIVQQGTNHAWVNRSGAVCRIAFVLVDAKAPE
ncbi:MAG: cupin domain-containing protein [Alphaproteobacteria bacterium]|nr:cupin domain-containing protein [Alphaproteobacteria bacterium]